MSLKTFSTNGQHRICVSLNTLTGLCETIVVDPRTDAVFEKALSLTDFNALVDLLKQEDHMYMINVLNSRFVSTKAA